MATRQNPMGHYILQERLGGIGRVEVWKAFIPQAAQTVVIKIFHADTFHDPDFIQHFTQEMRPITALRHSNIVRIYATPTENDPEREMQIGSIVMDYIDGPRLDEYIQTTSYMGIIPSANEIINLFASLGSAIDYAHSKGVIHGDIRPTNILIDKHDGDTALHRLLPHYIGEPILLGFENTKLKITDVEHIQTMTLPPPQLVRNRQHSILLELPGYLGFDLPSYLSPEQARGLPATERSDIYALGVILYEICTGTLPFQGESASDVLLQIVNTAPTPPITINPDLPPALSAIILHSLEKNPGLRFPTATAMVTAIAEVFNQPLPGTVNRTAYTSGATKPPSKLNLRQFTGTSVPTPRKADTMQPPPAETRNRSSMGAARSPQNSGQPASPLFPPPEKTAAGQVRQNSPILAGTRTDRATSLEQKNRGPAATASKPSTKDRNSPLQPPPGLSKTAPETGDISPSVLEHPVLTEFFRVPETPRIQETNTHRVADIPTKSLPPIPSTPPAEGWQRKRNEDTGNYTVQPQKLPRKHKKLNRLALLLLLALLLSIILAVFIHTGTATPPGTAIVGHVRFLSSWQATGNDGLGIDDGIAIDLHNIAAPQAGNRYYAWLLGDSQKSPLTTLSLGTITSTNGNVRLEYHTASHTNLLANYSRFLITEQSASSPILLPSANTDNWRYYAELVPGSSSSLSNQLTALRQLLVQAPELQAVGINGGLSPWMLHNTEEVLQWAIAAKDRWGSKNFDDVRYLLINILYYLDGACVQTDIQNLPAGTPTAPASISTIKTSRFALSFPCQQTQGVQMPAEVQHTPHDYLDHMLVRVSDFQHTQPASSHTSTLSGEIITTLHSMQNWLQQLHTDAVTLANMSTTRLAQSRTASLFGDMLLQARYAYAGRIDPQTGATQQGAVWINEALQQMTGMDVTPYSH